MKRYLLLESFNIFRFVSRHWEHPVHKHTYFEIILILRGSGKHHINGSVTGYASDDVFLLGPEDFHHFEIREETEFCYVRFTPSHFGSAISADHQREWMDVQKALFESSSRITGFAVTHPEDRQKLAALIRVLCVEYENRYRQGFRLLRDSMMTTILGILARNAFPQLLPVSVERDPLINDIVKFIRENISAPSLLTMEKLGARFGYASTYLSIRFRQSTGESLKPFIIKYRLRMIEIELLHSSSPLAEIATEFGFSDESHLCRQFTKYIGMSPTSFRKLPARKRVQE
jgi:AraC family transcriptional regulator, L-rhamnose operon regulatory protein RhaS